MFLLCIRGAFNHHKIYELFSEREIKSLMKCVVIVKGTKERDFLRDIVVRNRKTFIFRT